MSDYIPFEIQSEIIKRLPVKSIVQFRSVSKEWKSFIDNPEFIKTYHINRPNPQHCLLVQYNRAPTFTSIIDDNTFPQQKYPIAAPELLNLLNYTKILGSVDGLLCFQGWYNDGGLETKLVVLWNPSVRKCVGIPISDASDTLHRYDRIVFGVCPETNDPKLVNIKVDETSSLHWDVQVFSLSSHVWKTVFTGAPFTSCHFSSDHVFSDGIIYWHGGGGFIISFDLKSEKFGEVCLPERLVNTNDLWVTKVNKSLGLLEFYAEGGMWVCGVWMRKDGVNQPFTKIYCVKVEGKSVSNVFGFRNNAEVVIEMRDDDSGMSQIGVYEPSSGRINSVGIGGYYLAFNSWSYMETLLLLDQSNSIIDSEDGLQGVRIKL